MQFNTVLIPLFIYLCVDVTVSDTFLYVLAKKLQCCNSDDVPDVSCVSEVFLSVCGTGCVVFCYIPAVFIVLWSRPFSLTLLLLLGISYSVKH